MLSRTLSKTIYVSMQIVALGLILALLAGCAPDPKKDFTPLATTTYTRANLASLLGDQAPVVLSYGLESVEVQQYSGPKNLMITIEIFKLSDPASAYGLWSRLCDGKPFKIGNDGCSDTLRQLGFWQDRYMVNVLASTVASPEQLESFGRAQESKLPKGGTRPALAGMAPTANLGKGGVIYFHEQVAVEKILSIGADNPLGLSQQTGCVLAGYVLDGKPADLLLIEYPDETAAASGLKVLQNTGFKELIVAGSKGKVVGAVFGSAAPEAAGKLLGEALK